MGTVAEKTDDILNSAFGNRIKIRRHLLKIAEEEERCECWLISLWVTLFSQAEKAILSELRLMMRSKWVTVLQGSQHRKGTNRKASLTHPSNDENCHILTGFRGINYIHLTNKYGKLILKLPATANPIPSALPNCFCSLFSSFANSFSKQNSIR